MSALHSPIRWAKCSSCVMTMSWKLSCSRRAAMTARSASARLALFSVVLAGRRAVRQAGMHAGREEMSASRMAGSLQDSAGAVRVLLGLCRCRSTVSMECRNKHIQRTSNKVAACMHLQAPTCVQVGGGLIKRQNATVQAERLCTAQHSTRGQSQHVGKGAARQERVQHDSKQRAQHGAAQTSTAQLDGT